jgi:hypothetical protein
VSGHIGLPGLVVLVHMGTSGTVVFAHMGLPVMVVFVHMSLPGTVVFVHMGSPCAVVFVHLGLPGAVVSIPMRMPGVDVARGMGCVGVRPSGACPRMRQTPVAGNVSFRGTGNGTPGLNRCGEGSFASKAPKRRIISSSLSNSRWRSCEVMVLA